MITCVIQYELDPHRIEDVETCATTWPAVIECCGGDLLGLLPVAMAPTTMPWH